MEMCLASIPFFFFYFPFALPLKTMKESKHEAFTLFFILLLMLLDLASGDVNQDKAECTDQLVGLAPCLPYVGGQAKAPTMDCCGGLKQVLVKSKKCLCVLIKDKDDPSLGLNINASLAATLPHTCHDTVNLTECISLLHLAPNSQEAKLFQGYQKLTEKHSTSPPASGNSTSSAAEKSDGGMGKKRVGVVEIAVGVSLWVFSIHQNFVV
ncbi:hypothetical protein E1A91_D08G096000v1 [Gossypium mustelinum]|uniref:Bifunctional inhibitor/plant lipid transfer protein/seed storage helical domain-containing protein n=3 Tax=Gossypium TaxID=3633 RepID=A0A5J5QDX6_GOSBA|nr:hypothetical protein ES319_D08G094000v1 [Gossypium barbadense]TYH57554.1 hypothetical protein ES332_D08G097900v1 [Gossypium tomentosum]TYI68547.1 hypothetical protein E1A91_D08G096000v1 [Gossypium mustelinum]